MPERPEMAGPPAEVRLRSATAGDRRDLAQLARDPQVEPFLAPAASERLEAFLGDASDGGFGGLFVIELGPGRIVGGLGLQLVSHNSRICELTRLMVDPAVRGTGIGTRAVVLACHHALVEHDFHRVEAVTYGDNHVGMRVFERAGFAREGVRRRAYWRRERWLDGVIFGLLAEELSDAEPSCG